MPQVISNYEQIKRLPSYNPNKLQGLSARRLYDGTPAQRAHLLQILGQISAGTRKHLNVLFVGDSLAPYTARPVAFNHLQQWFPAPDEVIGFVTGSGPQGGTDGAFYLSTPSVGGFSKTHYNNTWTGSGALISSSATTTRFTYNGVFRSDADRLVIPILTEPGAGTCKIEIYDGGNRAPTDVEIVSSHSLTGGELIIDADGSYGSEVVIVEFAATTNTWVDVIWQSGGSVKIGYPASQRTRKAAINVYGYSQGSNSFGSETANGTEAVKPFIAGYLPDVIFVESDDGGTQYENFLPLLKTAIDGANLDYRPCVVLVGQAPKASPVYGPGGATDLAAANEQMRDAAAANGWYFFNGENIAETATQMQDLGFDGDGIHPSGAYLTEAARRIAVALDIAPRLDATDSVTRDRKIPTSLAVSKYADNRQVLSGGILFGGNNSHARIHNDAAQPRNYSALSFSFFGRIDSSAGSGSHKCVLGNLRGTVSYFAGAMGLAISGSTLRFVNEQSTTVRVELTTPITLGVPFFVTATADPTTGAVKIYINGILKAESTLGALVNTRASDVGVFWGGDPNFWVAGIARYAAMHSKILTADEVKTLYDSAGYADVGDEVFALHFDENVGSQIRDRANGYDAVHTNVDVAWVKPEAKEAVIRQKSMNVSAGDAWMISGTDVILPATAVVTGYTLRDNSGAATNGILVARSDGSTHTDVAAAQDVAADGIRYVAATADQDPLKNKLRIRQASAGGTDVDVEVYYREVN